MSLKQDILSSGSSAVMAQAIVDSINSGIVAAGTNQATATKLGSAHNFVATVAPGTGVMLPVMFDGDECVIVNEGANTLNIYPTVGNTIDSESANAAVTLSPGGHARFKGTSQRNYKSLKVGSDYVGFLQSGTGAVARTVQDELRHFKRPEQFGANGVDDSDALQAVFDKALVGSYQTGTACVELDGDRIYYVSRAITCSAENISIRCRGIARIQPIGAGTYSIFNFTGTQNRLEIDNITFYLYGTSVKGVSAASVMRQAALRNCQFVGSTGIDLTVGGSSDVWGLDLTKTVFQDCTTAMKLALNGQTFNINGGLFNNSTVLDMEVTTPTSNGSQLNLYGTVFENGATSLGRCMTVSGIKEVNFFGVQAERLGWRTGDTDTSASYEFVFTGSTVCLYGSRLWGGSYGSTGDGNSRGYGVYLDNSYLTLINSRLFSFREYAIKGANASSVASDLHSQVDFRVSGVYIAPFANIGKNVIKDGNFERFQTVGGKNMPFSWDSSSTTDAGTSRDTSNLISPSSLAGLVFTTNGALFKTNTFNVSAGEYLTVRGFVKATGAAVSVVLLDPDSHAAFPGGLSYYVLRGAAGFKIEGSAHDTGYFVESVVVPAAVTRLRIQISGGVGLTSARIEELACYRGVKAKTDYTTSVYSDNDGTTKFAGSLGPLVPYIPSGEFEQSAAPTVDTWNHGDTVRHSSPAAGGNIGWVCTTAGTPGTWKSFGAIVP